MPKNEGCAVCIVLSCLFKPRQNPLTDDRLLGVVCSMSELDGDDCRHIVRTKNPVSRCANILSIDAIYKLSIPGKPSQAR